MKNEQAYRARMDAIVVTPEMERRVLAGLSRALSRQRQVRWRALAACAAVLRCAAAAGTLPAYLEREPERTPPAVGMHGPVRYTDVAELAGALSYPLALPGALPEGYTLTTVQTLGEEVAELCWSDGTDTIRYRMAPGSGDISGDYTEYPQSQECTVGQWSVTCRGTEGQVFVTVWNGDGYSYSIQSSQGLSLDAVLALVESVEPYA